MKEYMIVMNAHHNLDAFSDEVAARLNAGWVLAGGLTVSRDYLYQALTRSPEAAK